MRNYGFPHPADEGLLVGESLPRRRSVPFVLLLVALFAAIPNGAKAEQFRNFTYTITGDSITITDFPESYTGAVRIPSSINGKKVTKIGSYAFAKCSGVTSFTLPKTITEIGSSAFSDCDRLTKLKLPVGLSSVGVGITSSCDALVTLTISKANPAFSSKDGILFNKAETRLLQYPTGRPGPYQIPDSVIELALFSVSESAKLTGIHLPAGLLTLPSFPFSGCRALASVTVDTANPALSSLDGAVFNKATTLLLHAAEGIGGTFTVPSGVTHIQAFAFSNCAGLLAIHLPESVTTVGAGAFYRCSSLSSILVAAGNPSYSSSADGIFLDKSGTVLITLPPGKSGAVSIPPGTISISSRSFATCDLITDLAIPASLSGIDEGNAFGSCGALRSITVDSTNAAFSALDGVLFNKAMTHLICCPATRSDRYDVKNGTTHIGPSAFLGCENLEEVGLPEGIINIDQSAFGGCRGLTTVDLPSTLKEIGAKGFYGCIGLTRVVMPAGLNNIGGSAFGDCENIEEVLFTGNAPFSVGNSAFGGLHPAFKVLFYSNRTGFTIPVWRGYPSMSIEPASQPSGLRASQGSGSADSAAEDADEDSDGDGVSNLMAYALGLNPSENNTRKVPRATIEGGRMYFRYYAGQPEVIYRVETSIDLSTWTTDGVSISNPDAAGVREASVGCTGSCRFMRLVVTKANESDG